MHPLRLFALGAFLAIIPACGASAPSDADAGDTGSSADVGPRHVDAAARACFVDEDCDDGYYCNGRETCVDGYCSRAPIVCDDHVACTADLCSETNHTCVSRAPDVDGDGFGDATCMDAVGVPLGSDCDDHDPTIYPGNPEICDAIDQDCDPTTLGGGDNDHDGAVPTTCCNPTSTGMVCGRDCDDTSPSISQLATEICDLIDNDCDGMIDEHVQQMSYPDVDHDGFGDATATPDITCTVPSNRANIGGDCDDHAASVHPMATEGCDGVDEDCDAHVDEGASATCAQPGSTMECIGGQCTMIACDPLHFDCNGTTSDGCEASLCDANHTCGACGVDCGSGIGLCGMGQCVLTVDLEAHITGIVHDATTHAGIGGATITTIDVCPAVTTTSSPDGTYDLTVRDHFRPRWVRIEAPGYPPHVQPVGGDAYLFSNAIVDAWRADPDAAVAASATRAILVIEGGGVSTEITHGTRPGAGNGYVGGDLSPFVGGDGTVFMGALPGRQPIGGHTDLGGGCSSNCSPTFDLWLVPGTVTHIVAGDFMCSGIC
jgi:hypothetical protein